jgi:hypothetical protein
MKRYDPTGKWIQVGRYWVRLSDGYHLPIIQGGTTPVVVQVTHRWVADDGSLTAATLLGSGNGEDITLGTGVNNRIRIRIRVEEFCLNRQPVRFLRGRDLSRHHHYIGLYSVNFF